MTTTCAERDTAGGPPSPSGDGGLLRWGMVLVLGGLLLFAHGCHADRDNELFALARTLLHLQD
jgi:hypothetical protein